MDVHSFYSKVKFFGLGLLKVGGNIKIQDHFFDPDTGENTKRCVAVIDSVHIKRNGHIYLLDVWGNEFNVGAQSGETLDAIIANIISNQ